MKVVQQRILADGLRADGKTGERDCEGGAGEVGSRFIRVECTEIVAVLVQFK